MNAGVHERALELIKKKLPVGESLVSISYNDGLTSTLTTYNGHKNINRRMEKLDLSSKVKGLSLEVVVEDGDSLQTSVEKAFTLNKLYLSPEEDYTPLLGDVLLNGRSSKVIYVPILNTSRLFKGGVKVTLVSKGNAKPSNNKLPLDTTIEQVKILGLSRVFKGDASKLKKGSKIIDSLLSEYHNSLTERGFEVVSLDDLKASTVEEVVEDGISYVVILKVNNSLTLPIRIL